MLCERVESPGLADFAFIVGDGGEAAVIDPRRDGEVCVLCGGGLRSMTAASLLRAAGRENVKVMLGGLGAWSSTACPVRLRAPNGEETT